MQQKKFEIAVIGLGLMGGSLAYALKGFKNCRITGYDLDADVMNQALERNAVDCIAVSLEEAVKDADLIIFCSGPRSIILNMHKSLAYLKPGCVITDICGVKKEILAFVSKELPPHIDYIGFHPMAGKEVGGFENADPNLFEGAGFILILPDRYREGSLTLLKELSEHVGAGRVIINVANEHDEIIAYTSDLMHISATALCVDFHPGMTMAHTAGAFRDCTRIANIDAALWTELLTKNAENIIPCLQTYINILTDFKEALEKDNRGFIRGFLQRASDNKRKMLTL